MSWQARLLNTWLRTVEKPSLRRIQAPLYLRRRFEFMSKLAFHRPFGVTSQWDALAGRPALRITPRGTGGGPVILYLHGGAFVMGSPRTHEAMVCALARRAGATAVLPRYPLAPEHRFPAALDHCTATYRALLDRGVDPARLVIGGDSAGGSFVFSVLAELLAADVPPPACVFAFSPLTDLTFSGESIAANARRDVLLPVERQPDMCAFYLGDHPANDPRVSPLFAGFANPPPVWLTVSDTEILLDDTVRLAARLRSRGGAVDVSIEHDLPHVWPLFHNFLPEARRTLEKLAHWIAAQTGARAATR